MALCSACNTAVVAFIGTDQSIKEAFVSILGNNYNEFIRITGNHKCDIQSDNKIMKGQVKKYKQGRFQQLDRHWVSDFIKNQATADL